MKILYISPLFLGLEDVIKGDKEAKGLPTFIFPLRRLVEDGNQVDMILISNYLDDLCINVEWLKKVNIIDNINNDLTEKNKLIKLKNTVKSFWRAYRVIRKAIKENKYDFVYCHSTASVIGNVLANRYGVPCGYRLYGTYKLFDEIQGKNRIVSAIKNFKYYIIFKLKKDFLLITDDGSHGDIVYNTWVKKKNLYKFHFWINGVDIQPGNEIISEYIVPDEPYIFMAGRVERGKGQLYGVKVLEKLHKRGLNIHLYLAGHLDDKEYIEQMKMYINKNKLKKYVHFLGPISREDMKKMSYFALTSLMWQDVSNAGNVFYEMFSSGAVIVAHRDGSLDRFVNDKQDIFLVNDVCEACEQIINISNMSNAEIDKFKKVAIEHAKSVLKTWNQRVSMEMELIYKYEKKNND